MFSADVEINKNDYLRINQYYLKKYLGIKEIILLFVLLVLGLVLFFLTRQKFILIMTIVTFALVLIFVLIYFVSGSRLYKAEFLNRDVKKLSFRFNKDKFEIDVFEKVVDEKYTEVFVYQNIEKCAILKDRVYIYLGAASMYYIKANDFTEGNFIEFCDFLKKQLPEHKFKMKRARIKEKVKP